MIGKTYLKHWYYEIFEESTDKEKELMHFCDANGILNEITELLMRGELDEFLDDPTYEEFISIIKGL